MTPGSGVWLVEGYIYAEVDRFDVGHDEVLEVISTETGSGLCVLDGFGNCTGASGIAATMLGCEDVGELLGDGLRGKLNPGGSRIPGHGETDNLVYSRRQAGENRYIVTLRDRGQQSPEAEIMRELGALRTLQEASSILGSTLEAGEIGVKLLRLMREVFGLSAAVIDTEDEQGRIRIWHSSGLESLWPKARFSRVAEEAREKTLECGEIQTFELPRPADVPGDLDSVFALYLPLRVQERVVGLLEAYGDDSLDDPGNIGILGSLATQAASALENARLYRELSDREARLEDLVSRLLNAQEEERRRVAYEVHDGLAQTVAAAHHHLQAYARLSGDIEDVHGSLEGALRLVKRTVGEARRVIAYLRPTTLDDFGLQTALRMEIEELRDEEWEISFSGRLGGERLPPEIETALYRIAQQAVNNVRKHAGTKHVRVRLARRERSVRMMVRDTGCGFDPSRELSPENMREVASAGSRVGVASMEERALLLGGRFTLLSRPGSGTLICVDIPLPEYREDDSTPGRILLPERQAL